MDEKTQAAIAQMLADQLKINAHLWASIQGIVSALKDSFPNFDERVNAHLAEAGQSEFLRSFSDIPELIRKMSDRLKP